MQCIFFFLPVIVLQQDNCNAKKKGDTMAKFKIPENPPTVNKTIRFPNNVVEDVEKAIQGKDCTFSSFVIAAVRAALEDLK